MVCYLAPKQLLYHRYAKSVFFSKFVLFIFKATINCSSYFLISFHYLSPKQLYIRSFLITWSLVSSFFLSKSFSSFYPEAAIFVDELTQNENVSDIFFRINLVFIFSLYFDFPILTSEKQRNDKLFSFDFPSWLSWCFSMILSSQINNFCQLLELYNLIAIKICDIICLFVVSLLYVCLFVCLSFFYIW